MTLSIPRVQYYLKNFELEKLFVEELGWDRYADVFDVPIDGNNFILRAVAHKRGVQIFECRSDGEGKVPDYYVRRKIEKLITKRAYEHLIVFTDVPRTIQIWQWVDRSPGQPAAYREHSYNPQRQSGEALIQKLSTIMIPLDEEEAIDLTGAVHKLRDAFDRDRVTKKFYDHFKREHGHFLDFIQGITDQGDKAWYASLMLNRLMFVYFIQKKGFLDGDRNYLGNRLKTVQESQGKGKFLSFYRYFLLVLFHEGFSKQPQQRELDPNLKELLGDVPYLNGGLFEVHELEDKYPTLDIPDEAFQDLFAFFDQYEWTLDTRPLRNDREINPDVLGYIFEKYINQKEMGAYYTKEDITEYISKNTVIPYLFDAARKKCAVAFNAGSAVWRLLEDDPDPYLYSAVRKGVIDNNGEVIPLPEDIEKGVTSVGQREGWNRPADQNYALPTETWREHVSRRQRCLEIREKLRNGEIHEINDFITYNLNIRQFTEDVISGCEGPELLRAFYEAISTVTVLDPTCGSGAFLFAALNILEPLYSACLDRMQAFLEELERSGERHSPRKFEDFLKVLAEVDRHPNRTYFILKSIIVNNLYGVDIMEEAVEICKLRLFLKLVAQVDKAKDLEPLPDIDFNIRPGNTLVGFITREQIREALTPPQYGQFKLIFDEETDTLNRIEEEAEIVERAYKKFHEMQTDYDLDNRVFVDQKLALSQKLRVLVKELDSYLGKEYDVPDDNSESYHNWHKRHLPFHWFAQFYGIMKRGGFDAIIGNPPYVEASEVIGQYEVRNLELRQTGNLFSLCVERFIKVARKNGRIGVILPISAICTPRMLPFMKFLVNRLFMIHVSNFAVRPAKLFVGTDMNLSIILGKVDSVTRNSYLPILSTRYIRWLTEFRPFLFSSLIYGRTNLIPESSSIAKVESELELGIMKKLFKSPRLSSWIRDESTSETLYYHSGGRYFRKCLRDKLSNEYKELKVIQGAGDAVLCILSSSLYYWLWIVISDCYHMTKRDIIIAPTLNSIFEDKSFSCIAKKLVEDLWANAETRDRNRADGQFQKEINFNVGKSKSILDEIDRNLAKHLQLTSDALDFILNYDAKFRFSD